ncbi:MAG: hypothetical protein ABJE66_31685, partial [Deltaproteobacteria bacterium]
MQGTCIDPNYPYCDLDGSVGGTPGACIAVTCTAGEFGKCNGATALTCNQFGTGYDQVDCAHGCDDATGCKLCEANQTACSNGAVGTCDANGNQTSVTQCPLGCFEDQPRCRDIDPSNHLSTYLDMTTSVQDVVLDHVTINTDDGTIRDSHSALISGPPTYVVPQPAGGSPIRLYVANKLTLGDITVSGTNSIAFLASGDVDVTGPVHLNVAGAVHTGACLGHGGSITYTQANASCYELAPGGGGGATTGTS